LKCESKDLKLEGNKEVQKVDALEQFGRRQNLEIIGVLEQRGENTNKIVTEVAKLLDVELLPSHISTSHRLPKRPTTRKEKMLDHHQL